VPTPPAEGSAAHEASVNQVKVKGVRVSSGAGARTPEETSIGLFWAYDGARLIGTPPRLFNQILYEVAEQDGLQTVELARMLAMCNLAMADAGIVCWRGKYRWKVWRPVVGIQNHRTAPVPNWQPLGAPRTNRPDFSAEEDTPAPAGAFTQSMVAGAADTQTQQGGCLNDPDYMRAAFTPNFPAYPSGHATFGAACFDALRRYRQLYQRNATPDRIDITVLSDELNGASIDNFEPEPRPREPADFDSIEDMIVENAESRIFLGLHWDFDATSGVTSGKQIGEIVASRAYTG
jgi:hypothetical protein